MSNLSYVIVTLLRQGLACVPIGTNQGLFTLLWALLCGRFLASRGAVFPALAAMGLTDQEVRRCQAALANGRIQAQDLVCAWNKSVRKEEMWRPHCHEGIRPVACDLTAFFRAHLSHCTTKYYTSKAHKALKALVYGLCVEFGSVGVMRLGVRRLLLRQKAGAQFFDLLGKGDDCFLQYEDRGVLPLDACKKGVRSLKIESIGFVASEYENFTNQASLKFQPAGQAE